MPITINIGLIGLTAIISFLAFNNQELKNKLLFYPFEIYHQHKQYYRFITHGFVHADMTHLLFNMFTLYFFGQNVEYYLIQNLGASGRWIYIAFYLVSLIVAALPSYFKQKNNNFYRSLGASGAVSSMLFASILINPTNSICLFGILCLPAYIFGPLYLFYSIYASKNSNDNIGHDAHYTGAIFGLIGIVLLVPDTFPNFIKDLIQLFQ